MAVKTIFSKEDLSKILLSYNLGKLKRIKPLKLGAVQTNLLLETTKDKFVFRYYENRQEKYALFEVTILQYLSSNSYPCPAPIKDIHGNLVGEYENKPFAIFEFMKGEHRKSVNPKLIAQAIGKLHKITIGYKPKYFEVRDTYDQKSCWKNANSNTKKIKSKYEAKERLQWLNAELGKLRFSNNLPRGVCHCDTHPSNFLYKNEKLVAVLDFDDASYISPLYDIANMIYFWAWPHKEKLNFEAARTILKEYSKSRKLTKTEKNNLYESLKMVIFMSIGWFIDVDDDFTSEKKKIEALNSIGRREFYRRMFKK